MTEPTNREIAEVARRAADIIQARGKATGKFVDTLGRLCAVGAIREAGRGYSAECLAQIANRAHVAVQPLDLVGVRGLLEVWSELPHDAALEVWNDLHTTTELDIAKVFLQVADDLQVAP